MEITIKWKTLSPLGYFTSVIMWSMFIYQWAGGML